MDINPEDTESSRRTVLRAVGAGAIGAATMASTTSAAEEPVDEYVDSPNVEQGWRSMDDVNWIVVHWAGTSSAPSTINTVTQPGNSLGYHYIVNNYTNPGKVTRLGRPEQLVYHARGLNSRAIGVCYGYDYYGGSGSYYVDDECLKSMAEVVRYLGETYDIPLNFYKSDAFAGSNCAAQYSGGIIGHTHVPWDGCQTYTHCPGIESEASNATQSERYNFDVDQFMQYVNEGTSGGGGGGSTNTFEDGQAVRAASTVNTRESPGLNDDVIAQFEEDEPAKVVNGPVEEDGYTWWGLHWTDAGVWGWSVEGLLEACPGFCHDSRVITSADLNVRWGPGYDYYVRHTVPEGQTGRVIEGPQQEDDMQWWHIEWDSGVNGWSADGDWLGLE